jgi:hypothetical protein
MVATLLGIARLGAFEEGCGTGDQKERYVSSGNILSYFTMILCTRQNLPENQCVLVRGYRVTRAFGIFPRLRGAAGPDLILQGDDDSDDEPDKELTSIASETKVRALDLHFSLFHLSLQSTKIPFTSYSNMSRK